MPVFGYRPSSKLNILRPGQVICVAAVYNTLGEFKPVAFGVVINDMRYRFKISKVIAFTERHGDFIFNCEYMLDDKINTVRLVFDVKRCRWVIG